MVVGVVVVALGGVVVVRLLGGDGLGSVGGTIGLIFSPTYTYMYFRLQIGRLCEGAHKIPGIPAPLWICGWVGGGFRGRVGG